MGLACVHFLCFFFSSFLLLLPSPLKFPLAFLPLAYSFPHPWRGSLKAVHRQEGEGGRERVGEDSGGLTSENSNYSYDHNDRYHPAST